MNENKKKETRIAFMDSDCPFEFFLEQKKKVICWWDTEKEANVIARKKTEKEANVIARKKTGCQNVINN